MDALELVRPYLARVLDWQDAHASYDFAVKDFPADLQGARPAGFPYSAWELIEHLRITQRDILDFCQAATYHELRWPDQYWPASPAPAGRSDWRASVRAFQSDREALKQIALNSTIDLTAIVPHGTDQTYLRELLLVADHNAYHVAQLILLRRVLGVWPAG
jgi:DinB superfamily